MAKIIEKKGEIENSLVVTILLKTDAEISDMPTTVAGSNIVNGCNVLGEMSIAFCAKTGNIWMLDSDGWQAI